MLTATLRLDRLDRDFRLLERREQPCRSFLKGFLEALYVSHAQLDKNAPYSITNVDGQSVPVSVLRTAAGGAILFLRAYLPHNRIGSPPGFSLLADPFYWYNASDFTLNLDFLATSFPGCDIGIQVGNSNTAVTTTDRRMGRRIGHGRRAPDGAPVVFEQYAAGDDTEFTIYDVNWAAQLFIPTNDHRCTSVKLKLWKLGAPPADLTVDLRGWKYPARIIYPGDTNLATGAIPAAGLGGTPGALVELVWPTPVDLYAGHLYWLVAHTVGGAAANSYKWRKQTVGTPTYDRAAPDFSGTTFYSAHDSANSGTTWSIRTHQYIFQELGQSIGEFDIGGCELAGIAFADPNGSFQVRRFFWNNCGMAVDVKEAGIQVPMGGRSATTESPWHYPFLVARDVVAPTVTVNNAEILLVTYTFQITV